jgi:Mg-chelatase subunit ChlD
MTGCCRRLELSLRALVRVCFAIAATGFILLWGGGVMAGQPFDINCQQAGFENRKLECDVRFQTPKPYWSGSSVTAAAAQKGTLPQPTFEPYRNTGKTSAVLVLVDASQSMNAQKIRASTDAIDRILSGADPRQDRFGLAVLPGGIASGIGGDFSRNTSLSVLVKLGGTAQDVKQKLNQIQATGRTSPIFRSTIEAIRELKNYPAERRAVILFSDAKFGDPGFTIQDVITEAKDKDKDKKVTIFAFGIAEREQETLNLQALLRLAEETNGVYFGADLKNRSFSSTLGLESLLPQQLDNGGRVTVDLAGVKSGETVELTLNAVDTAPVVHSVPVQFTQVPPTRPAPEPVSGNETVKLAEPLPGPMHGTSPEHVPEPDGGVMDWIKYHGIESTLIGIALALLILALVVWSYRALRRGGHDDSPSYSMSAAPETFRSEPREPMTTALYDGNHRSNGITYATLQPVREGGTTYRVGADPVRIGRASANDICLPDKTVSAVHAMIVRKHANVFELRDQKSLNGIWVNGQRVERCDLSDGDLVAVGAFQFRFRLDRRAG